MLSYEGFDVLSVSVQPQLVQVRQVQTPQPRIVLCLTYNGAKRRRVSILFVHASCDAVDLTEGIDSCGSCLS